MLGGGVMDLSALPWTWILVALLPLGLAACTAFTKTVVVLSALRIGLGARELLPFGIVAALATLVTALIMAPVFSDTWTAVELGGGFEALWREPGRWFDVLAPLQAFLERHASGEELSFFADLGARAEDDPLVLVPAFMVTELSEALHVAVLILLPFVVVDLLLAEVLTLLGLPQVPVATVAMPAKVLLFLAAGGWDVIVGGLVEAYA